MKGFVAPLWLAEKNEGSGFNRLMVAIMAPLIAIDVILAKLLHLGGLGQLLLKWPGLLLLIGLFFYTRWRGFAKMLQATELAFWAALTTGGLSVLIQLAGRTPYPLVDGSLARIDAAMHFQTVTVVHLVARLPILRNTLAITYAGLPFLIVASLLIPTLYGRVADSRRYILGVIIAALMTAVIFAFLPAAGPWTVEGYAPGRQQAFVAQSLALLKSNQPLTLSQIDSGVVALPSFHVVLAILSVAAMWNVRGLRWITFTIGIMTCVSAVTTGWHYGIDIVAGLAVTYASYRLAGRVLRKLST